jgi:hypothetical protein
MIRFNLNRYVYVKLNDEGLKILEDERRKLYTLLGQLSAETAAKVYARRNESEEKPGYYKFQMWEFMNLFGDKIGVGFDNPVAMDIYLEVDQ